MLNFKSIDVGPVGISAALRLSYFDNKRDELNAILCHTFRQEPLPASLAEMLETAIAQSNYSKLRSMFTLPFESAVGGSYPVLARDAEIPFCMLPEDDAARRALTPLLVLRYLVDTLFVIKFNGRWRDKDEPHPAFPSNMHVSSFSTLDLGGDEGVVTEIHEHRVMAQNFIPFLLGSELRFNSVKGVDGRYALHPYFSMDPEELWATIISADCLLTFAVEFVSACVENLTNTKVEWFNVNAAYLNEEGDATWDLFKLGSSEACCASCGTVLEVYNLSLSEDHTLNVVFGTSRYLLEDVSAELPRCSSALWTAGPRSFDVNFPSGKIWYADWMRTPKFKAAMKKHDEYNPRRWHSINYEAGRVQSAAFMASRDVVHGSTGNEAVILYQLDKNHVLIAGYSTLSPDYEDCPDLFDSMSDAEFDSYCEHYYAEKKKAWDALNITELGSICTDLWAYTLVDESVLRDIEGDLTYSAKREASLAGGRSPGYFKVSPGKYTHLYLSGLPAEEAIALIPAEMREKVASYKFKRIHALLTKLPD